MKFDKEKSLAWAKAHLNQILLGAMVLLLLVRIYIYTTESSIPNLEVVAIKPVELVPLITPESPEYQKVRRLIEPRVDFAVSEFALLEKFNMFDPQVAQSAEKITADADALYKQAKQSYDQAALAMSANDVAKARASLEAAAKSVADTLNRQPNHALAQQLRAQIAADLKALDQPAGATPPGGAPPGAPAAPPAGATPAPAGTPAP